jgi:iron-sulfur cluster repair protein YtfE (RIC family)
MTQENKQHEVYQEMLREHEELRALLGKVNQLITDCTASPSEVQETVHALCHHIQTHFETEESEGYFAEALMQAPRVSERVAALKAQHVQLREQLAKIAEIVGAFKATGDDWKVLAEHIHHFSVDLMHHENSENELLQEVFTDDIGSKD